MTKQIEMKLLTFWEVLVSVLAGAFGVQSNKNRERDFTRGNIIHFIIIAVALTALFIFAVMSLVQWVLPA